jgi:hypothetical protein
MQRGILWLPYGLRLGYGVKRGDCAQFGGNIYQEKTAKPQDSRSSSRYSKPPSFEYETEVLLAIPLTTL